jgi:alkylhydroperoxidase family enzyme
MTTTYLPPVERPRGLLLKIVYLFSRRQFGKVPGPVSVFSARMPAGFLSFYGKVSRLDKKLKVSMQTAALVREQVASLNMCHFCMDASRWYALRESSANEALFDALPEYRINPLFSDAQRAALDYATELTRDGVVSQTTFDNLEWHFSEREICDIVWLVASEHLYNKTNVGLNIGSDGFCEVPTPLTAAAPRRAAERSRAELS